MEEPNNINDVIANLKFLLNNSNDNNNSNETVDNPDSFNDSSNSSNDINFDINTFIMLKKVMDAFNLSSNDSRSTLLYSLKPYLRKEKQDKIDQYIQLLKIEQVIRILSAKDNNGGDSN